MRKVFLSLLALPTLALATTHTVSTRYDEAETVGSLRQIISIAEGGDSIIIPEGLGNVELEDELLITKTLSLNANGNTIQVGTPSASTYRLFQIGDASGAITFTVYNATLKGGNLTNRVADAKDLMNCGGIGLINDYASFILHDSKAVMGIGNYAGAFYGTERSDMQFYNSYIAQNRATTNNAGAVYNLGTLIIDGCLFEGNIAQLDGAAVATNKNNATVRNTVFYGNESAQSTSANNGGTYFNTNKATGVSVKFENCTFHDNAAANKGGGAFTASGQSTTYFTNCTFYGNSNNSATGAGAIYSRNSIIHMINCTVAGNTSTSGTGGITIETTSPTLTLINSIAAYNYSGTVTKDIQISAGTVSGTNNVVGTVNGSNNNLAASINFTYTPESVLFAEYTNNDIKLPVLADNGGFKAAGEEPIRTIALAPNTDNSISVATEAGAKEYTGYTLPTTDQRGFIRNINYPCVGAYELNGIGSAIRPSTTQSLVLFPIPAHTELNIAIEGTILSSDIFTVSGQHVQSNGTATRLSISDLNSGLYLIQVVTTEGTITRQFVKTN